MNLPEPRTSHCSVTLHDGNVMVLGGYLNNHNPWPDKSALIVNFSDNTIINAPDMNYPRRYLACALFYRLFKQLFQNVTTR